MKIKLTKTRYQVRRRLLFTIMKTYIFLLCATVFSMTTENSFSQEKIIINKSQLVTVDQVFRIIKQQTNYRFIYPKNLFKDAPKIQLEKGKIKISKLLEQSLSNNNLNYKLTKNNTIIIEKIATINIENQQQREIKGTVTDSGGIPLPGVNIIIVGTVKGTETDFDGKFQIDINDGDILEFSYIGMKTVRIPVGTDSQITIVMEEDAGELDEIVIIGYGVVKKSDLTGSVSSVKSEEITATPSSRLDDAIRGKVAGVQITPTSSQPGASSAIRIRGTNSLSGNSSPLFVIDGFIGAGNSSDINVLDIESVEILKDASATALFGSRGSAGVILITTKRGKIGKGKISYNTYTSFQSPTRLLPVLNAAEFADWQNEVQGVEAYPNPASYGEGTNWQKETYRSDAPMISHTISASGGNEKSKYYLSGNYFNHEGIFRGGELKRYQFRFNGDHNINDVIKVGNSVTLSRIKSIPRGSNIINTAGYFPTLPVKDENGKYTIQTESSELSAENPVGGPAKTININTRSRLIGSLFAEIEPIEGLKYKLNFGTDLSLSKSENYRPSTLFDQVNDQGTASISNSEYSSVLIEQTLSYKKEFGEHRVDGLLGYTRQKIKNSGSSVQTRGFTTDFFEYNNIDAGVDRSGASSYASKSGLESFLFRVNYGYKDKYLLTFNARVDGSSNFAESKKYGTFPSIALAWRASQEEFINNLEIFDDLKLRVSYGRLGNPASGGSSLARLGAGYTYLWGPGQNITNGIGLNRLGNESLKFETTDQLDIGIDASFFDKKLHLSLDYYKKETKDLFANENILWLAGVSNSSIATNFGVMQNSGFELTFTSVNIDTDNFTWETSFNVSTNKNKLIEIPDEDGEREINHFGGVISTSSALLKVGEPVGVFYGLIRDGIWNTQEEIDAAGVSGIGVFPGGRQYQDISGPDGTPDGVIDLDDRTIIGNPNPELFGGLSNTLSYKNFEFSMYWSFVFGNDIFNETDSRINTAFDNNVSKRFVNRWTPTNTDTDVPSVRGSFRSEIISESGVVEDGSFLRLRNISLAYRLPLENIPFVQNARIYISATNLLLFDSYSGYDPEINRGNSNTRRGYDQSQDPAVKSWTIGLEIDF